MAKEVTEESRFGVDALLAFADCAPEVEEHLFRAFYEASKSLTRIYVAGYTGKTLGGNAADIIVNNIFVRVVKAKSNSSLFVDRSPSAVVAWLKTVARNEAIAFFKQEKRHNRLLVNDEDLFSLISVEEGRAIADPSEGQEMSESLDILLGYLAEERYLALRLFLVEELSGGEIAERLGLNLSTVKMRISRGRERLARELAAEQPDLVSAYLPRPH